MRWWKKKKRPVWTCNEYKKGGVLRCNSPIIVESILDKKISEIIEERVKKFKREIKESLLKEYIKVLDTVNNQEFINLKQKILELDINRENLIDLNLKMIINNDELQSKLLKNDIEKNEINSRINSIKNKDNSNKILVIEKNIELLLNVKDNLNIYTNLFIDRIMVIEGDTRYKMDFEIHLKNKEIVELFLKTK